jgi:hypothetical protein
MDGEVLKSVREKSRAAVDPNSQKRAEISGNRRHDQWLRLVEISINRRLTAIVLAVRIAAHNPEDVERVLWHICGRIM